MSVFGDDDYPQYTPLPPPPPPQEIMDVIDEIAGVQYVTGTNAKGQKQRFIQRLPRTPEEENFFRQGQEIMGRAIQTIKDVYRYNPNDVVNFKPIIDTFASLNEEQMQDLAHIADFGNLQQEVADFKQMQNSLMEEEFERRNSIMEADFARQGIAKSTTAQEIRAFNSRNQDLARQQANIAATQYGEDLANSRLKRNASAYELRQRGRDSRLQKAQMEYALEKERLQEAENLRQNALRENYALFNMGANLTGQDTSKAMMSKAPEFAMQDFGMRSADQLNRYNASLNAHNINYQNQLAAYNSKPPSFGDFLLQTGGKIATAYATQGMF